MIKDLFSSSHSKWLWVGMTSVVLLCALIQKRISANKKATLDPAESSRSEQVIAETLIPRGHVLLPLHLENIESLSALIGGFALIDLYIQKESRLELIASRVKLLQAPLNPQQYAVMAPRQLGRQIMQAAGPYWATVLNRTDNKADLATTAPISPLPKKTKRRPLLTAPTVRIEYHQ